MTGLRRSPQRRGPIAEINMIPLIDVALVLLIIFMVMTPFLVQQQIRVNLRHVPDDLRPAQETPDPDDDPTRQWRERSRKRR